MSDGPRLAGGYGILLRSTEAWCWPARIHLNTWPTFFETAMRCGIKPLRSTFEIRERVRLLRYPDLLIVRFRRGYGELSERINARAIYLLQRLDANHDAVVVNVPDRDRIGGVVDPGAPIV